LLDLEEVKVEDGGLTGTFEIATDECPIYFACKMPAKGDQIIHGAERRPDAFVIGMLNLGVHDEVSHQVRGRGEADAGTSEIEGLRMGDDFGGRKEGLANAHAEAVVKLEMD